MSTAGSRPEPRRAQRKPMLTIGEIDIPGREAAIECTVLDLSTSGAKLKLSGATRRAFTPAVVLPETFRLIIARDGIAMDCRLAWRADDMVGVAFSGFKPFRRR
jgi:hypothetical protein